MGNLFGKHKEEVPKSKITSQDQAVLKLKTQRDKLKQYEKKIRAVIERERAMAKELCSQGLKDKALALLRKKRYQEQLISKTQGQLDNLDAMVEGMEFQQLEREVVDGLEAGNSALKAMQQEMSIEDVERIMDETREGVAYVEEINELVSGKLTSEDDAAVDAEFEALFGSPEVALPDVPTTEPVPTATAETTAAAAAKTEPQLVPA